MKKVFNHWFPKMIKVSAIVIYPYVLFSLKEQDVSDSLDRHEMKHVEQVRSVGWFSFYASYLLYYFAGLLRLKDADKAYLEIPYEVEARQAELLKFEESVT